MADQRRSKRRRSNSIDSIPSTSDSLDNDGDALRDVVLVGGNPVPSCIGFGMSHALCCEGCRKYADHVGLSIDFRGHDNMMVGALTDRHKTGQRKQCLQVWSKFSLHSKERKHMRQVQCTFITERGYNPDQEVVLLPPTVAPSITPGTGRLPTVTHRTTPRLPVF